MKGIVIKTPTGFVNWQNLCVDDIKYAQVFSAEDAVLVAKLWDKHELIPYENVSDNIKPRGSFFDYPGPKLLSKEDLSHSILGSISKEKRQELYQRAAETDEASGGKGLDEAESVVILTGTATLVAK